MGSYRSPSTGSIVRAVLFDTFGTVVDWRTGIASAVGDFARRYEIRIDATQFADAWRSRYQPAMHRVRSGQRAFVDLDTLHRENLDAVLRDAGLDPAGFAPDDVDALARSWRWLPPWPDSVAGISALATAFIVGPLSNGNTALLVDMAKYAGLPWDVVLGSDVGRSYKPDPAAYRTPVTYLGLEPGRSCWWPRTTAIWRRPGRPAWRPASWSGPTNTGRHSSATWSPRRTGMWSPGQ